MRTIKFIFVVILSCFFFRALTVHAVSSSFVTIVNPIRGEDTWDLPNQQPVDAVMGQMQIINRYQLSATWLIRFDALSDHNIINVLKSSPISQEKGLFLEVTPSWTTTADVNYRQSAVWHNAGSVFLTGYNQAERLKLIDTAFIKFKEVFGYYPKSVGAWWVDSYSLQYMSTKYGVTSCLIVADQFSTDNYQIWGQYWEAPYYPAQQNALIPAQTAEQKIPVVMMQWASRDPVNGYGEGVQESTYSVQANDYLDYHNLGSDYFAKLLDIYTKQPLNSVNQLVVGLENSYSWTKYQSEYDQQLALVAARQQQGQFQVKSMEDFANYYSQTFPSVSSEHIIVADDPLGTNQKAVWFMDPYYRIGWFYNNQGSVILDIHQYISGSQELCFDQACQNLNFATSATRVLDDVTNHQQDLLDPGQISNFQVEHSTDKYIIKYTNEAGRTREVQLLPRDIGIDNQITAIDSFILQVTTKQNQTNSLSLNSTDYKQYQESLASLLRGVLKFILFLLIGVFIPGYLITRKIKESLLWQFFVSVVVGISALTLLAFIAGYLKMEIIIYLYLGLAVVAFAYYKCYQQLHLKHLLRKLDSYTLVVLLIIIAGTIFQCLAIVKSGWVYPFGMGFLGPLGHDGIWHQALINQLEQQVPPLNPSFSATLLSNYHYFYDLLLAQTDKLTTIGVLDLLYRFYPILLSLLLGLGTYLLADRLFNNKWVNLTSLYFVYFGSSFGWIVQYLHSSELLGGESAFWMNQPVSMNLNPPFAISLIMLISLVLLIIKSQRDGKTLAVMIAFVLIGGVLIEFKVYAGLLALVGLGGLAFVQVLKKDFYYLKMLFATTIISLTVFLPQNSQSAELLVFSPFWFIHSMVDFTDRVGWLKLSQARLAYYQRGETLKYILVEVLGLTIFLVGNLGTRIIGLFSSPKLLKVKFFQKGEVLFITLIGLASLAIPIFYIQQGNPWNTIQFSYYALYLLSVGAGASLYLLSKKLPTILGLGFILLVLVITPISSYATFKSGFYNLPPARLMTGELAALDFLHNLPSGIVLTYPYDKNLKNSFTNPYPLYMYETTSYVSAFSGKTTFLEDEIQQEILEGNQSSGDNYQKRLVEENDFFNSKDISWSIAFLNNNHIEYIYLPIQYHLALNIDSLGLKNIFENDEAVIYQKMQ
ncbi:hypothetical protein M1563_02300 [Patescibacteria group bacterium]|nr:hypothetical protein [Patescibacteria group bacterium]